jgi:RNA polymerase sigma-70 factor (ECF subfamily)
MTAVAAFKPVSEPVADELEQAFRQHSRLVYRTAYSVTGRAQDAEDIVQTLFLRLARSGFPADFQKNPDGYLYRAAVNLSLNAVKARRRHASAADPADLQLAAAPDASEAADPKAELQTRLIEAMTELSPRAVEMLVLRYEHNTPEAEIARLLGTSRGAVAVTLFRARARLRKLLVGLGKQS